MGLATVGPMPSLTISPSFTVEEVVVTYGDHRFIIRREPGPDDDGTFITTALRSEAVLVPDGDDLTVTECVDVLDDPGGPLIAVAREWALTMPEPKDF